MPLYDSFKLIEGVQKLPASQREALRINLEHVDRALARVAAQDSGGAARSQTLRRLVVDGDLYVPAGVIKVGPDGKGNVVINTNGIKLNYGTTNKIWLQTDGDVFIGDDTSLPAKNYIAIFSAAQTYNSESMGAGDMLIGDNSSSKANILWDKSAGQLLFRGGTSAKAYIDTTGAITAGTGEVVIDDSGIKLIGNGNTTTNSISWYITSTNICQIYGWGNPSSVRHEIVLNAGTGSGTPGAISLYAVGTSGTTAGINLDASSLHMSLDNIDVKLETSHYIGLGASAGRFVFTDAATDSIAVTAADLNPALGVNVGTATGATTGEVRASDKLRLGGQTTGGIKQQSTSVANNGVTALFAAGDYGLLVVEGNGNLALYYLKGAGHATVEINDSDAVYSVTATTAGSTNIYWSGANSRYELENKRGGTLVYTMTLIGTL